MKISNNKLHFFIFPESVNRDNPNENTKLEFDREENVFIFSYMNQKVHINLNMLESGTSTCVCLNTFTNELYTLYNFREIVESLNILPSEFLKSLKQKCFLQIEKLSRRRFFIKAFTLVGEKHLDGDPEWLQYENYTKDQIIPIDRSFTWEITHFIAQELAGSLYIEVNIKKADVYSLPIYISYAGQSIKYNPLRYTSGVYKFDKIVPGERVYFGSKNTHCKGRSLGINVII